MACDESCFCGNDGARRQAGERFHQQIRAHRGQACAEFDGVLVRPDLGLGLQEHVAGIEAGVDAHGGDAGARLAVEDGPLNGPRPAVLRQQRGVHVDDAERRQVDHGLRNDLAVADHHHGLRRRVRAGIRRLPAAARAPAGGPARPIRAAASFTGGGDGCCPRPRGRSGWVTTASTWCPASTMRSSVGTAKAGVPKKTRRIRRLSPTPRNVGAS